MILTQSQLMIDSVVISAICVWSVTRNMDLRDASASKNKIDPNLTPERMGMFSGAPMHL